MITTKKLGTIRYNLTYDVVFKETFTNVLKGTAEILNIIQNLYKVANKREIVKIQDEFYRIYKQGDIPALERFLRELDVIAEGYRAQNVDEFDA